MTPSKLYQTIQREGLSGRELEASLMSRAARKLNRCVRSWDQRTSPEFRDNLDDALSFNQKLWTFLQVELSNPEHPIQADVRRSLLRLARYMDKTVMRLYSGGSLEDLQSLQRINEEIAAGLLQSVRDEQAGT